VKRLDAALASLECTWELIFVDDSDDQTPEVVRRLVAANGHRVSLLHREPGRRQGGLGGAVKRGFAMSRGEAIVVMDADLQHPPEVVPNLVAPVLSGKSDLVAGSRYGDWGSRDGLAGPLRHATALACRWLAYRLVPESGLLTDPMSGLFAIHRSVVEDAPLRPEGYKILLEIVAHGDWHTVLNVDYRFSERHSGESKAGIVEGLVFLRHLCRLFLDSRRAKRPKG
jgi:dolichol-phosphate mannosyltransferase